MPVCKVITNMARNQIPVNFVVNFNKFLAPMLGKDLSVCSQIILRNRFLESWRVDCSAFRLKKVITSCHADESVTTGDDAGFPMIVLRVWSFGVFGELEKRNRYSIEIYKFLKQEFPQLKYDKWENEFLSLCRVKLWKSN